jgi:hypothetical protein
MNKKEPKITFIEIVVIIICVIVIGYFTNLEFPQHYENYEEVLDNERF